MKIRFLILAAAVLLVLGQGTAAASLADYVAEALTHNHELAAARAASQAATASVRKAGVLPDPMLGVEYYLQSVETRTGPQEAAISLNQRLPWPGKLSLQKEEVSRQSAVARSRLREVELKVVRQVKEVYLEYALNKETLRITEEGLELLRYFEAVALTRYSAGTLDYAALLKIQVELARLEERHRSLTDVNEPLRGRLNALLGASRDRARPLPERLPVIVLAMAPEDLHDLARRHSPRLAGAEQAVAKARTGRELAEKDFYPDLTFSLKTIITGEAEYGDPPDSGRDPVIAGLSITLPLFRDRRHGAVAAKEEGIRQARHQKSQEQRTLDAALDQGLYRYRDAQRRRILYEQSVLPKVRQELEVGLQGFQDGRQGVFDLLNAEKNLLEFELNQRRAVAEQALEVARLEELVGATLAAWQETAATPSPQEKKVVKENVHPQGGVDHE
jgi:outer membrane protein TolC